MNEHELTNLVYNHQYTEDEKAECYRIVQILEKEGFINQIGSGFPIDNPKIIDKLFINNNPNLYIYILAIKDEENTFNYYYIEYDNSISYIMDFQEKWLLELQKQATNENVETNPLNCLLYFLIHYKLDNKQRSNYKEISYQFVNGKCMKTIFNIETNKNIYESLIS